MNKPMILVVEDDAPVRNLMSTTLKTHDYKYLTAPTGRDAIMMASSHNPDVADQKLVKYADYRHQRQK